MVARHVFPQGVLAVTALVGGGTEDGGSRAGARFELGLYLYSVAINTLSGVRSVPRLLEQKPWGFWLCSLEGSVFFSPHTGTHALEWGSAEAQGGLCGLLACVNYREVSKLSLMHCLCIHLELFLSLCSDAALGASPLRHLQWVTAPCFCHPPPIVGPYCRAGRAYMDSLPTLGHEP